MTDIAVTSDSHVTLDGNLRAADYHRVARALKTQPPAGASPVRLAMLTSYSVNVLEPFLVVEFARRDLALTCHFGAFGQFEQELAGDGPLWAFSPNALVLAIRPEDVDPEAVSRFHAISGRRFDELAQSMLERIENWVRLARERMRGPIVVANVSAPPAPLGVFDAGMPESLTHAINAWNRRLADMIATSPGVYVWDYAGVVRSRGAERWGDERLWALARAVVAQEHQAALAAHLARTVRATLRPPAKCLVLDLDNTLWGGVIGDDGPAGIQLSDDYPGNVFKNFQRAIRAFQDRGILLAVASKNNHDIVEETLRTHPEMVLRWDDFACVKANWQSKSENLREIAAALNIGLDAMVLFDDNPVERAEVRSALPEVGIVEAPTDPIGFTAALRDCELFDQTSLHVEDRERGAMYRLERERRSLESAAATPDEFLHSLDMEAEVGRCDEQTLGRIAQLVGKTNQFNLTTRRHTLAEIAMMARDQDHVVAWLRLRDRFGDQGLVAVGILRRTAQTADIETLLMSCRVMNRRVEHAFVAFLVEQARALGCDALQGSYLPTAKNSMVKNLYPELGFTYAGDHVGGGHHYHLDVRSNAVSWPAVIRRRDAR